jgi:hypothetical protein
VDYNPLKGMLVLISSSKLSTVLYSAGPESRGHSRTAWLYIDAYCFTSFIVRWILNFVDQPTHENHENWYPTNKSDFTVYKIFHQQRELTMERKCGYRTSWQNLTKISNVLILYSTIKHKPKRPYYTLYIEKWQLWRTTLQALQQVW